MLAGERLRPGAGPPGRAAARGEPGRVQQRVRGLRRHLGAHAVRQRRRQGLVPGRLGRPTGQHRRQAGTSVRSMCHSVANPNFFVQAYATLALLVQSPFRFLVNSSALSCPISGRHRVVGARLRAQGLPRRLHPRRRQGRSRLHHCRRRSLNWSLHSELTS